MRRLLLVAALATAALVASELEARACGGCFNPPETPTVVTDHRMILSVSQGQSTLYDQFRYTGSPASFGWVLPYSGEITVGISSDVLFSSLDTLTQTQILPPPTNCPIYPASCPPRPLPPQAGSVSNEGDVSVLKHEVVGPYETVQLAASNPTALEEWLAKNGYTVPDAAKPVVAAYQAEHFNFLALKLVPGKDVQDMQPVRVTTKGANVALPLRMIAAGTGPVVGVTLWVVAEGRYETANFDMFAILSGDIAWDWTNNKSNYIELRTQKNAAGSGRLWELESAFALNRATLEQGVANGGIRTGPFVGSAVPVSDAGIDQTGYAPIKDGQGQTLKTAEDVRKDDFDTLFAGIPSGSEHITRIRADLDHAALDHDLLLKAAADQSELSRTRQVVKELNEPQCTVYNQCNATGTAPRSQAAAQTAANTNGTDDGCSTTSGTTTTWLAIGLGVIGIALGRRRRS